MLGATAVGLRTILRVGLERRPRAADGGQQFVGREAVIEELAAAFDAVRAARPHAVVVEGLPGMGKTALLRHFVDGRRDARLVLVSGVEAEALVPYGVVARALSQLDEGAGPRLDGHEDLSDVGGRLLAALGGADEHVTIVVVDDAQWADQPSLEAIAFAFRRLEADRVLLLAGTRPSARRGPLDRLVEEERGRRITLEPFTPQEVASVAARAGYPILQAATRRLWQHTHGLPLHVLALLRELDRTTLEQATGSLPAPKSFATLVLQRVTAAGPDVESLLAAAAVLGERSSVSIAADVAGVGDVVGALDGAVAAGLVGHERSHAGDVLVFTHSLVRTAILDALSPARRVALHRRAAEVCSDATALEHRAAAALVPDASLADELATRADVEASDGSVELAVRHFLDAARLTPDDSRARARRLDALETLTLAGAVEAANALAAQLDADMAPPSVDSRVAYLLGHLALLNGRSREAEGELRRAFEDASDRRVRVLAATQLAQLHLVAAHFDDAVEWTQHALALGADDAGLHHVASGLLVVSLAFGGRHDEALSRALPQAATEAALLAGRFDEVAGRGLARLLIDDLDGARADLEAVGGPARHHRPLRIRLVSLGYLAEVEYRRGRWADSIATSESAVSLADDANHVWLLGLLHGIAALPLAARGEWDAAQAHVDAAAAAAAAVGDAMSVSYATLGALALAAAKADHDAVLGLTDLFTVVDPSRGSIEPAVLPWRAWRAEALVARGRVDEAAALVDPPGGCCRERARPSIQASALLARGIVEAARGEWDAAVAACTEASAVQPHDMPFDTARVDLVWGTVLRRAGKRRAAAEHLQRALDRFAKLGADPYADRATEELTACGLRPRRRGPHPPALTPREHAIARLVADGLTNREIAERLVVSPKTVEYHLGNAFVKLGVRNRAQLAAGLIDAGDN